MIERLSRFVLNETNIEHNTKLLNYKPPIIKKIEPKLTSLFWCIYQLVHPNQLNPGFQEEQSFKFTSIEKIRELQLYKNFRIKLNDAEQSLLSSSPNRESIQLLCALYKLNVVVVYDNYYYDYTGHGDGPIYYIFKPSAYYIGEPVDLKNKLSVDPIKPLYAISHYTLPILQEMATTLGITGKTKTDLYDKIKTVLDI